MFTNQALIWDAKTGEGQAYKTNQGLSVRATFDSSCTPMDEKEVKATLYTLESMACGDESGNANNGDDKEDKKEDSSEDSDKISKKDDHELNDKDSFNEEDDDIGCGCSII